jgi:RHS repeat-associated protein
VLRWNYPGWALRRRDGLTFYFPDYEPLSAIEDPNGNRITIVRSEEGAGPITEVRALHGRWIRFTHDSYNRITEAVDNAGQRVRYEYDGAGRLAKVIDPMGRPTRYSYDAANQMTSVIDARGHVLIENHYEANGRLASQTLATKGTYTFKRLPTCSHCETEGKTGVAVTNPDGEQRDDYFEQGRLVSEVRNPGPEEEWTTYTRNANGDTTRITSSSGSASYTYDSTGDVTSIERESATSPPLLTTYAYNEFSEPIAITEPLGNTSQYSYAPNGNLTRITDPMGGQTTFGYDGTGELTSVTNPEGHTTTFTYLNGEPVSATNPLGDVVRYAYDPVGRLVAIRDAEGRISHISYDNDNEITSETDPAGDRTIYTYDAAGNLIALTDPRGHAQTGEYNAFDQLTSWTDPLGRKTTYNYDGAGKLIQITKPNGQTITDTYNALGWLSSTSFGKVGQKEPTSTINYAYDTQGDLASVKDSRAGTWTMAYDPYHRLTSESGPNGTVSYSYNAGGEREALSVNGEEAARYSYNPDGLLTGIATPSGNVSLEYNEDDQTSRVTLPNSDSEEYNYNSASQLAGITFKNATGASIGALQYARDQLGRVSTVSGSDARTNLPEPLTEATYDAANELTKREGHTLTYDENGDLTNAEGSTYAWNDRGQLEAVTQGSNTWNYSYDPFGRRTSKTTGGTETRYLWDGTNVIRETFGGNSFQLLNGLATDQRYARTSSSGTTSYLTDQAGSTVALTEENGQQGTEYTYGPYGEATATGTKTNNPYQYTGRENDENGLQDNRARYYAPAVGRFISQDPLGLAGSGVNLYRYVGDAPTNATDPSGLYNPLETVPRGECEAEKRIYERTKEEMHGACGPAEVPASVEKALCELGAKYIPVPGGPVTKVIGGQVLQAICQKTFKEERPGGGSESGGGPGASGSGSQSFSG